MPTDHAAFLLSLCAVIVSFLSVWYVRLELLIAAVPHVFLNLEWREIRRDFSVERDGPTFQASTLTALIGNSSPTVPLNNVLVWVDVRRRLRNPNNKSTALLRLDLPVLAPTEHKYFTGEGKGTDQYGSPNLWELEPIIARHFDTIEAHSANDTQNIDYYEVKNTKSVFLTIAAYYDAGVFGAKRYRKIRRFSLTPKYVMGVTGVIVLDGWEIIPIE